MPSGPQQPPVPQVYTGSTQAPITYHTTGGPSGSGSYTPSSSAGATYTKDGTAKVDDLMEKFSKAPVKEQRKMALLLALGGYAGSGSFESLVTGALNMTLGNTLDAYNNLLNEASVQFMVHGNKITAEQLLRKNIAYVMPAKAGWDGNLDHINEALDNLGYNTTAVLNGNPDNVSGADSSGSADQTARKQKPFVGTKTTTSSTTVRDVMDPADAKALTRAMLQRELGRDPTEEEFADFIGAVQYAQRTHPSRSRTTNSYTYEKDKYAPGGSRMVDSSSNTVTHSGIGNAGIADIALQKARQNPNWAEWQAVGTYAPALFEALGATVQGR
jgi:hypothetical protein